MLGYLGEIRAFGGDYAPQGWALCNGSTLPISGNEGLYSLLGTIYGGDGVQTFGLPNLQGKTPVKIGTGTGLSPYTIGQQIGAEGVTLTQANLPAHTHTMKVSTATGTVNTPANNYLAAMKDIGNPGNTMLSYLPGNSTPAPTQALLNSNTVSLDRQGSTTAHENRQPYVVVSYIICTQGLYPTFND